MKRCTRCGQEKLVSEFNRARRARGERSPRGGLGVSARCKLCCSEERNPGLAAERAAAALLKSGGLKRCGKCGVAKAIDQFHKRIASSDGLAAKCKPCVNADSEAWREKNPDANARWVKENRDYNAERFKLWREQNSEHQAARLAQWAKSNPEKVRAKGARRIAAKLRAIPAWANPQEIEKVYADAARITREKRERHEVDHVVPLQSPIVCGLHWEGNLQILPKVENISKLNRFWPDMP